MSKLLLPSCVFVLVVLINLALRPVVADSQIIPFIDYLQSWFETHETAPYKVVRNITPDVEERIYISQKWACTQEFSTIQKIDDKRPDMFFRLFMYSDGKNEITKKIQISLPISTAVDHRNGDLNSYEMCFYLPENIQENPPKPNDPKVTITTRPEIRVYSKRFSGYAGEFKFANELRNLATILKSKELPYMEEELSPREIHYNNIYDAPAKFWNRRNEVWLVAPPDS